jgi:hypothetical protein
VTDAEFRTFIGIHAANFQWFGKWFWGEDGEPPEEARARYQAWFGGLRHMSLDEAQTASLDLLYSVEKPQKHEDHLAVLRASGFRRRQEARERNATPLGRSYGCDLCKDTGLVEVTAKPGVCLFSQARKPMPHGIWTVVDCRCGSAVEYSSDFKGDKRDKYDEKRMETRPAINFARSWEIIAEMRAKGEDRKADAWERFLHGGTLPSEQVLSAPPE